MTLPDFQRKARQQAIEIAQHVIKQKPIYIDTETTGLDSTAEIVEISVVDHDGSVLLETIIRPKNPIPSDAQAIHHISNEMVKDARPWYVIWPTLRPILFGRMLAFYNADFDMRMMKQSYEQYGTPWKENFQSFDILKLYAQFATVWDPRRRSFKYHSLEAAGRACNIPLQNTHRATADTLLTRALLHYIANYKLE